MGFRLISAVMVWLYYHKSHFGGMSRKNSKQSKTVNTLFKFLPKIPKTDEKPGSPSNPRTEAKRKLQPPPEPSRQVMVCSRGVTVMQCLRQKGAQQVLEKCPKLEEFVRGLVQVGLPREEVASLLLKYLQSSPHSLWTSKYAPRCVTELFNISAATTIRQWLHAFSEYKNKITEEDSFINEVESQKSNLLFQKIRDNQWGLQALIVRGRPGVGKTSALRAIARELDIDLQQCGSDYNQAKYLKEKHESTQSESVKTAYSRKQRIEKNAQMITKFMAPVAEKEKPKQNQKGQLIHNMSMIFPETEANKFYNELARCINLSKIPFLLTNSGERIPKECDKYDIIEYHSGNPQKVHQTLWAILHIQRLGIDTYTEVDKDQVFEEINRQLEEFKHQELVSLWKIKEVCQIHSYRLDCILTFLQQHWDRLGEFPFASYRLQRYKALNEDQLLEEIQFIDCYKKCASPGLLSPEKFELNTQQSSEMIDKSREEKEVSLKHYTQKLHLLAAEDTLPPHDWRHSYDVDEWTECAATCIDVSVHRGIRNSLTKMANQDISAAHQRLRSSLRPSELSYLPMLFREKRTNRGSRTSSNCLRKIFDENEFCYLQRFGQLLRQQ